MGGGNRERDLDHRAPRPYETQTPVPVSLLRKTHGMIEEKANAQWTGRDPGGSSYSSMDRKPRLIRISLIPERNLPAVTSGGLGERDGSAGRYSLDRQSEGECQKTSDGSQNDHDNNDRAGECRKPSAHVPKTRRKWCAGRRSWGGGKGCLSNTCADLWAVGSMAPPRPYDG